MSFFNKESQIRHRENKKDLGKNLSPRELQGYQAICNQGDTFTDLTDLHLQIYGNEADELTALAQMGMLIFRIRQKLGTTAIIVDNKQCVARSEVIAARVSKSKSRT